MKELKLYQCEICGTQYKDKEMAEECEQFHSIPKKVEAIKYRSIKCNFKYPDYVNIAFNDGSIRRYKYDQ